MRSTSSLGNQEWEQETKDTEGMIPQLGNSNPMDNGETHSDPIGSTIADHRPTSVASIAPDPTESSIATLPETTITETFSQKSEKLALALFA